MTADSRQGLLSTMAAESERYAALGVSSAKHDVQNAISGLSAGVYPSAFCKVMPDILTGSLDHSILSHADGAGSKSILAYLHYRHFGQPEIFRGIAQDAIVMNLDDLLCAGCVDNFALTSIVNRNAKRIPSNILKELVEGSADFIELMRLWGVNMVHCGGETADLGDAVRTVTVDSVLTARIENRHVVQNRIPPGAIIVGLASGGEPAAYEAPGWNSGIGSNGLTFARHELLSGSVAIDGDTALADDAIDANLVYRGPFGVADLLPHAPVTVLEALLSPTRTFAPIVAAALHELRSDIFGLVHCSGGGQAKCLRFGDGIKYRKRIDEVTAPLFKTLYDTTSFNWGELAKVFNLGYRFEIYCAERAVPTLMDLSASFGVPATVLGETADSKDGNRLELVVHGEQYEFTL